MATFWGKRIKNISTLANNLGVEEEKIKELKDGEREVYGKTMDNTLANIEELKIKDSILKADIYKWYIETDLKKIREDFGYFSQGQLAIAMGVDNSTISQIENKKYEKITNVIIKYYNFFQNDFNRNVDTRKKSKLESKELQKIWKWYKNIDAKQLRLDKGINSQKDLAKMLNMTNYQVSDFELHRYKKPNDTIKKMYDFYNDIEENISNEDIKKEISNDDIFDWYKNTNVLEEIKKRGYTNATRFRNEYDLSASTMDAIIHKKLKSVTPKLEEVYNILNTNEEKEKLEEIKEEQVEEETIEPVSTGYYKIYDDACDALYYPSVGKIETFEELEKEKEELKVKNSELVIKNKELELELARYRKLIDLI